MWANDSTCIQLISAKPESERETGWPLSVHLYSRHAAGVEKRVQWVLRQPDKGEPSSIYQHCTHQRPPLCQTLDGQSGAKCTLSLLFMDRRLQRMCLNLSGKGVIWRQTNWLGLGLVWPNPLASEVFSQPTQLPLVQMSSWIKVPGQFLKDHCFQTLGGINII